MAQILYCCDVFCNNKLCLYSVKRRCDADVVHLGKSPNEYETLPEDTITCITFVPKE